MAARTMNSNEGLLSPLYHKFTNKLSKAEARKLVRFACQYYASSSHEELSQQPIDDIYGATLAAWKFIQKREVGKPAIQIFNPNIGQNGWQSTHTVAFILFDDKPFLVDSLRMECNRRNLTIHALHNATLGVKRVKNELLELHACYLEQSNESELNESLVCLELDRLATREEISGIEQGLKAVLENVSLAVRDFHAMDQKAESVRQMLLERQNVLNKKDVEETCLFLQWLLDNRFTFLGYEYYSLVNSKANSKANSKVDSKVNSKVDSKQGKVLKLESKSLLGVSQKRDDLVKRVLLSELPNASIQYAANAPICSFAKSTNTSRVHRPAYYDYVMVKEYNLQGKIIAEHRFVGLYTSVVYMEAPAKIPLIRQKVQAVLDRSGLPGKSHNYKELLQVLAIFPREELFQYENDGLFHTAMEIMQIKERRKIRLFIRKDSYGKFFSCLVYTPRDLYNTDVRKKAENILCEELSAVDAEFTTYFSESILARTHFILRAHDMGAIRFNVKKIEQRLLDSIRPWKDELHNALVEHFGEEKAVVSSRLYLNSFSSGYREHFDARVAAMDIKHI